MKTQLSPWLIAALCMGLLSACSKTVTWEEEVPLNTGEVIWVERSVIWEYSGGHGNPFDMAMRPTGERSIRFQYKGKEYIYADRADIHWVAISPQGQPSLVAPAASFGWDSANGYTCVTPYYVQFILGANGKDWVWPEKIEPWLYELPANILINVPKLDEPRKSRYSNTDRNERDRVYRFQAPYGAKVDALYIEKSGCINKYDPNSKPNETQK